MPINLLSKADFEPRSFVEAERRFADKAALTSDLFERLSTQAKQRAFRIAGVHKARMVQRARDLIKRAIREATPWPKVRRQLLALYDVEGVPAPALHRLSTMFRQNVQTSYNDARREALDDPEITEAFPFRRYLTVGNGSPGINGVRAEHAALHGLVFRWDDPFWDSHTPPWDWGCRCTFVPLTPGQVKRMRVKVRNIGYVRKQIRVRGQKKRGIAANAAFDRGKLDLSGIDQKLRGALEEMLK